MNTLEMLKKLTENTKRKAIMLVDVDGNNVERFSKNKREVEAYGEYGAIRWTDSKNDLRYLAKDKRFWRITEPPKKLKAMSFGEAFWYFWNEDVRSIEFKSIVSGKDFARREEDISKEEYLGLWTVEGIYEEE